MQLKLKGQSVHKTDWKQTDGQTDRRTLPIDLTFPANAVGNEGMRARREWNVP